MAQFLRPDETLADDGLSIQGAATVHGAINETSSSTSQFVYYNGARTARVGFGNPATGTPTNGTNDCTIRWTGVRLANGSTTLSTDGSGTPTVTITLYENGSAVSPSTTKTTSMSTGASTFSDSLVFSSSIISNWNNVQVLISLAENGGGPNNRDAGCAWLEIEVPDVPAASVTVDGGGPTVGNSPFWFVDTYAGSLTITGAGINHEHIVGQGAITPTGSSITLTEGTPSLSVTVDAGSCTVGNSTFSGIDINETLSEGSVTLTGSDVDYDISSTYSEGSGTVSGGVQTLDISFIQVEGTPTVSGGTATFTIDESLDSGSAVISNSDLDYDLSETLSSGSITPTGGTFYFVDVYAGSGTVSNSELTFTIGKFLNVDAGAPVVSGGEFWFVDTYTPTIGIAGSALTFDTADTLDSGAGTIAGGTVVGDTSATLDSGSVTIGNSAQTYDISETLDSSNVTIDNSNVSLSVGSSAEVEVTDGGPTVAGSDFFFVDVYSGAGTLSGGTFTFEIADTLDSGAPTVSGSTETFAIDTGLTSGQGTVTNASSTLDTASAVGEGSATIAGSEVTLIEGTQLEVTVDGGGPTVSPSTLLGDVSVGVVAGSATIGNSSQTTDTTNLVTSGAISPVGSDFWFVNVEAPTGLDIVQPNITFVVSGGLSVTIDPSGVTPVGATTEIEHIVGQGAITPFNSFITTWPHSKLNITPTLGEQALRAGPAPFDILVESPTIVITGQFVKLEWEKDFVEGDAELSGGDSLLDVGLPVDSGAATIGNSTQTLIWANSFTLNVTSNNITPQGASDITLDLSDETIINVDGGGPIISGATTTSNTATTVTSTNVTPNVVGVGTVYRHFLNVTDGGPTVSGSEVGLEASNLVFNVDSLNITIQGQNVGLERVVGGANYLKIDGGSSYIIDTQDGNVLLYPRRGGYFIIGR